MSWLGMNAHVLARCSNCLTVTSPVARTVRRPLCQTLRLASTQAKPRPVKAATTPADASAVPKKKISTKSTTPKTPKTSSAKKVDPVPPTTTPERAPVTTVKGTTRASSTKTTATPVAAKAQAKKSPTTPATARRASTSADKPPASTPTSGLRKGSPTITTQGHQGTRPSDDAASARGKVDLKSSDVGSKMNPGQGTAPRQAATNAPPGQHPKLPHVKQQHVDTFSPKSPEYKRASRKYTAVLVALPILVVTSYYLFDRLALGNTPKSLDAFRRPNPGQVEGTKPKEA